MAVGIIGLDLGVTTGMAWGIWNPALRDQVGLWTALARGRRTGCRQIYSEDTTASGIFVGDRVMDILADWNLVGLSIPDMRICIEDFQARPQSVRGGGRKDKLAPVFLGGMVLDYLIRQGFETNIRWFNPSLSMGKATDARLKDWAKQCRPPGKMGWVKGKQHSRDAWRLIATGLDKEV